MPDPTPGPPLSLGGSMGVLDTADLVELARMVRIMGLKRVLMTAGQRIILPGLDQEQDALLRERFGHLVRDGHDMVQACPGRGACPFAKGDAMGLGRAVERMVRGMDLPAKLKVGVSGCANCCAESRVRDLGFVAGARGWTVLFGGNAGKRPRCGDELGRELADEDALDLARQALERYGAEAEPGERTARFAERAGLPTQD